MSLAFPAKKSEEDQLPAANLNPLLNPVLGAHMGRWAEVYFTSPPERREEAVLDLLRELEGETPPKNETAPSKQAQAPQQQPAETHPRRVTDVNEEPQALTSEKGSPAHNAG